MRPCPYRTIMLTTYDCVDTSKVLEKEEHMADEESPLDLGI